MTFDWVIGGGFIVGAIAGGAARYGRLCTMSAVEDALVGRDFRGLKAWSLVLAVAIAVTQGMRFLGWIDLSQVLYASPRVHLLGTILGGTLFGLGMTLVGTCSFGLLVRAGGGDMRAIVSAGVVGIAAMTATAGALALLRESLLGFGVVSLAPHGGASMDGLLAQQIGRDAANAGIVALVVLLAATALLDRRLRLRRRLLTGAVLMGLAVGAGWLVSMYAVDALILDRPESLSFVAPVGRALLQIMIEPFRNAGFGVSAALGVMIASLGVALWRREFRWEAFDDAIEMRRHLFGSVLMGLGGVLAQGCTIGQGLSAASTLAITAPIFVVCVLAGAKIGLWHLIEGSALWRLGR